MAATMRITTMRNSIRGALLRPIAIPQVQQLRAFSLTSSRSKNGIGPLPTFTPTSSAELDALIAHLRKELFIPPHLLERQLLLTNKTKHHSLLLEDPIYFPIGNQTVQLTPKLIHHHLPRNLFTKCLQFMQKPSDFDAVPGLVLGYTQGSVPLYEKHISMAVRKAGLHGRADVLLRILEQAEFNKIVIPMDTAREGFRGFLIKTYLPSERAAVKAVRQARRLRDLLAKQDTLKLGSYTSAIAELTRRGRTMESILLELGPEPVKLARDPVCLGTLAGITSRVSEKWNGGLDHKGYTADFVAKLFDEKSWNVLKTMVEEKWEPLAIHAKPPPPRSPPSQAELDPSSSSSSSPSPPGKKQPKPLKPREQFHLRRSQIATISVLLSCLRSALTVLTNTHSHITSSTHSITPTHSTLSPTLLNPTLDLTPTSLHAHAQKLTTLTKRLRMELPLLEQIVGRWVEVMVADGDGIMEWSPEETRRKVGGSGGKYEWAAAELVRMGFGGEGEGKGGEKGEVVDEEDEEGETG